MMTEDVGTWQSLAYSGLALSAAPLAQPHSFASGSGISITPDKLFSRGDHTLNPHYQYIDS